MKKYGVLKENIFKNEHQSCAEEIYYKGYSIYNPNFNEKKKQEIDLKFEELYVDYKKKFKKKLKKSNEYFTIRSPLLYNKTFFDLAFEKGLNKIITYLLSGNYYLNQQNGVINPSKRTYNQDMWHRDLPYTHFTTSRPIAINALYCIDDFTNVNGPTMVLPGTHLKENFPSEKYCKKNEIKILAKRGEFILLDCLIYHKGSRNNSKNSRRAINHVFSHPIIKQQIYLKNFEYKLSKSSKIKKFLGNNYRTFESPLDYINSR